MESSAPDDITHYLAQLSFPGSPPFTRGIHPTMYRGRHWTMRQYAGFGTAATTNRRFHYLLKHGQNALSVAFDLPTQLGLDSDAEMAKGEVGRVGVAIANRTNMQRLFQGVALDQVSTSMTINATAPILLTFYMAVAESQNVSWEKLRGTVQNDILKEFIARGNYIYPPKMSLRLTTDLMAYCQEVLPLWYPISVSGYHIREAGATAVQELAFTFANAVTYLRAAKSAGTDLGKLLRRLTFFFSVDNHFLEEIAKFRAARRLFSEILNRYFSIAPKDQQGMALRFHAQTGGSTLTAQQPKNNIVRVALQAMAATLGGAQSIHTNAWDEALSLPSEASACVALRTQQIIAHESEVVNCVDPVGGARDIESRTQKLFEEALNLIEKIEAIGGSLSAIESNYFQRAISDSAYQVQSAMESGAKAVVGINKFTEESGKNKTPAFRPPEEAQDEQLKSLKKFKAARAAQPLKSALDQLKRQADTKENLLPGILAAVKAEATLGEISGALQAVFGNYRGDAKL